MLLGRLRRAHAGGGERALAAFPVLRPRGERADPARRRREPELDRRARGDPPRRRGDRGADPRSRPALVRHQRPRPGDAELSQVPPGRRRDPAQPGQGGDQGLPGRPRSPVQTGVAVAVRRALRGSVHLLAAQPARRRGGLLPHPLRTRPARPFQRARLPLARCLHRGAGRRREVLRRPRGGGPRRKPQQPFQRGQPGHEQQQRPRPGRRPGRLGRSDRRRPAGLDLGGREHPAHVRRPRLSDGARPRRVSRLPQP